MNQFPADLGSFLSFFQLNPVPQNAGKFLDTLARIHGYILIATDQLKDPVFEQQFLEQDHFGQAYLSMLETLGEDAGNQPFPQILCDRLLVTLGPRYQFITDSAGHLHFCHHNKGDDLFPFVLIKGGLPYWLIKCKPGHLTYIDFAGNLLTIESHHPSFEEIVEALLEKGWYKTTLRSLEGLSQQRKSLENKEYSAHCFLGCEYYKAKQYPEAILEFEKAMTIKPNMPQLYYNLALSHARARSYRAGIHLLNQLNRIHPNQPKSFELLGDFYFHLGNYERSWALYQKAYDLAENKTMLSAKMKRLEEKIPRIKAADSKKEEEKEEKFFIQSCLQDLTLEAEQGRFQPVVGRDSELLQMQEILACQSKKNVLVLGDPGVGKTALIYELAYRMIAGKVSPRFQNKKLIRINMGTLLAGAKFRGQFEERLMQLIREVKKQDCILFIDDIHQIASGTTGKTTSMEATHFLKPALMNDEIHLIGATNFEEFRNTIEKDNSFLRCFQIVKLDEPDDETLLQILRGYRASLENYHQVLINEESLETAIMWVRVLLRERALPDKALDLLDRAAARISIQEKSAIVTSESILRTLSEISNVPLNRMSVSETVHYRNIETFLSRRVVGQPEAVSTVSRVLCTSKLRMMLNPSRPKGIFLFVGPTGVGKTELAKAMAQFLFGDEDKILRIDMSEYMERYSASRLIGTSPGYVGYYDQNQLVDKIRTNPYSLILLDEIEKADSQLLNIFLQVFDAGRLTDGKGKVAYFDNATIVMTSNIGTHLFAQNKLGYGAEQTEGHVTRSDLLKEAKRFFPLEFLNRIDEIVFFKPLGLENVREIANLKLNSIFEHLKRQEKELFISDNAMLQLCKIGYDYEYGARNLERVLRRHLLDKVAELALNEEWPVIQSIEADWHEDEVLLKGITRSKYQEVLDPAAEHQDFLEE